LQIPRHDVREGARDKELPFPAIDPRGPLDLLPHRLKDGTLMHRVLVTNAAQLYNFE
jgi:hypothetical protein